MSENPSIRPPYCSACGETVWDPDDAEFLPSETMHKKCHQKIMDRFLDPDEIGLFVNNPMRGW